MTASGKSQAAFEVARDLGAVEIVSVDSMAVYRGMDIATAKATRHQRDLVPHHLLDILDPSEEATLSWFQTEAKTAVAQIEGRGHHVLLVGGTGLYHRAVVDDFEIPGQFLGIRAELQAQADEDLPGLYARLQLLDPLAASRMEESNLRRIVRALEVIEGTGRAFSSFGPGLDAYPESAVIQIGVARPLGEIDDAIEARVGEWLERGLEREIDTLLEQPGGLSRTASQAIGYAQLFAWRRGELSLDEALASTVTATRQFARRQRSWFGRDPRVRWFDSVEAVQAELVRLLGDG
jgi:tRNA dimethylallyltransferase